MSRHGIPPHLRRVPLDLRRLCCFPFRDYDNTRRISCSSDTSLLRLQPRKLLQRLLLARLRLPFHSSICFGRSFCSSESSTYGSIRAIQRSRRSTFMITRSRLAFSRFLDGPLSSDSFTLPF